MPTSEVAELGHMLLTLSITALCAWVIYELAKWR